MEQALLYKKLSDKKAQCQACAHYCVILPDQRGLCGVKENQNGKLYSLVYDKIIALHIDPIEKKPLYHFLPGTYSLSLATVGCNFVCQNCQNWDISQSPKLNKPILGQTLSPEKIVQNALDNNCPSISYTYTEPTIFLEYALKTMKLAKEKGLKNIWVTNGFMSPQTLDLIIPELDAANVDLKSFEENFYQKYCGGKLKPILENLKELKRKNIWLEITTLIIPGLTDKTEMLKKIAQFIKKELGAETPWHISRFSPEISWKLKNLPVTSLEKLENAEQIGLKTGLKHVYKGNI
ncbi:MAG: AmmeMemoRadiSam system radical SAM enzyme [Parcubacteria group bacterium]|nr:AmmeMemoRadiSam system radical SAM enzyme [Parcubacteria group bacterium]